MKPGERLLEAMEKEVGEFVTILENKKKRMRNLRCKLCPFRCFAERARLLQHVKKHHTKKTKYCASGTKQIA